MVIEKILFIIYIFNKNKKKLVSVVWNLKYFKVIECLMIINEYFKKVQIPILYCIFAELKN